jgi:hypothetical protein
VDLRDLLTGDRPLEPPEDQAMWQPFADAMGLSPYACKALFTCGVLREMLASSGLCLGQNYHLGALFLALDATELVGRSAGGFREQPGQAGQRLREGLRYLERIDPNPRSLGYSIEEIVNLRHFLGHGAASARPGMSFTRELTIRLLRLLQLLALALNRFWTADEDSEDRLNKFAQAEISPMITLVEVAVSRCTSAMCNAITARRLNHRRYGRQPALPAACWAPWLTATDRSVAAPWRPRPASVCRRSLGRRPPARVCVPPEEVVPVLEREAPPAADQRRSLQRPVLPEDGYDGGVK